MKVPPRNHKYSGSTWDLMKVVGVVMELMLLDPGNKAYYEGRKDALVSLIGEHTGFSVVIIRRDLENLIQDMRMEDKIEDMFGDVE